MEEQDTVQNNDNDKEKARIGKLVRSVIDEIEHLSSIIKQFPDIEMQKRCLNNMLSITQEVKDSYYKYEQPQQEVKK